MPFKIFRIIIFLKSNACFHLSFQEYKYQISRPESLKILMFTVASSWQVVLFPPKRNKLMKYIGTTPAIFPRLTGFTSKIMFIYHYFLLDFDNLMLMVKIEFS